MSLARDYFTARERHQAATEQRHAADRERDRERMDLEDEAASRGYDTTELEAHHERERAAEQAAALRAEAQEQHSAERDAREAWAATREIAADDDDGPAMEDRVNAFFDEVARREIARWTLQQPDPEPPEFDDTESEI